MPLTARDDVRDSLMDSIFARGDLSKAMPKYQFPDRESFPADVFQVIRDELLLDGNARQNLATFCQTWEEPEIHKIMDLAIDKNMVDKDEYSLTAEIESRCVHMLADLWNSPDSANTLGTSAVGSSEACMLGGMAMKWRWRARGPLALFVAQACPIKIRDRLSIRNGSCAQTPAIRRRLDGPRSPL